MVRVRVLATALFCAAVAALVGGSSASATTYGTHTYCNSCPLGSIPAVGPQDYYTSNHSSTFTTRRQQIYYSINGNNYCSLSSSDRVFGLNYTCETGFFTTTARCHLLNDGSTTATCWADWRCDSCQPVGPALMPPESAVSGSGRLGSDQLGGGTNPLAAGALDAGTAAWVRHQDSVARSPQIGTHVLADSRRLGALPDGRVIYLVPTTMDRLCVVIATTAESCGNPLTRNSPITFTTIDPDGRGGVPPIAYGTALTGVASVSFAVAGTHHTVEASNSMFVFRGAPDSTVDDFSDPTARFADGTTVALQ
jgi:hypothetical protein